MIAKDAHVKSLGVARLSSHPPQKKKARCASAHRAFFHSHSMTPRQRPLLLLVLLSTNLLT